MTTRRIVLVLVACMAITLMPVRADMATCEPECDPLTGKQCATMTNGPNRCINIYGYGTCTQSEECPPQDGFTLTCVVGQCIPSQFFQFSCSENNPCTAPEVCTHFILPNTDDDSGWCVPPGSLYAPCSATSECNNYDTTLFTVGCKDGYCQIVDVDVPIPCTADAQAQCTLGCDTTTGFCKVDNSNPNPDPVACTAESQEQCGIYGCDLDTGFCKVAPSGNPDGDGLGGVGAASNVNVVFSLLFVATMAALAAIRM